MISHTIFQLPTKYGKGVLVTPTVHGNLMLGPTAVDELDKENIATTAEGLEDLQQRAGLSTPNLPKRQTITSFAGLRAHTEKNDLSLKKWQMHRDLSMWQGLNLRDFPVHRRLAFMWQK